MESPKKVAGLAAAAVVVIISLLAFSLILAFGKTPRDLGVPGEEKLKGRGVSYCAVCEQRDNHNNRSGCKPGDLLW